MSLPTKLEKRQEELMAGVEWMNELKGDRIRGAAGSQIIIMNFGSHSKHFEWDGKPVEGFVKAMMWSVSSLVHLKHFYSWLSGSNGDGGGLKQ